MPKKRKKISKTTMKKLDTKKTKIDQVKKDFTTHSFYPVKSFEILFLSFYFQNQLSQMSKRRKIASETKNVKIDEVKKDSTTHSFYSVESFEILFLSFHFQSSSANQETPTTSQDTKVCHLSCE